MSTEVTETITRAFELAKGGECGSIYEIEKRLNREGYFDVDDHLSGTVIRRQLNKILQDHKLSGEVNVLGGLSKLNPVIRV